VPDSPEYTLKVELTALRHLGIGLYSNVAAVLAEAVANSYDADATEVSIDLDDENQLIKIADNGDGMNRSDANARFLKVGYERRKDGRATTPRGRAAMGRKGIGKLSIFSIARVVELRSIKHIKEEESGRCGFRMRTDRIEAAIEAGREYNPEPIDTTKFDFNRGTSIVLTDLKRPLGGLRERLRQRLARRFSVIGDDFSVRIDGQALTVSDRGYLDAVQYLWTFGGEQKPPAFSGRHHELDGSVDASIGWTARGWVGTVDERKRLQEGDNAIVVLARGKLVHEDILKDLREAGVFAKYVVGEISADFLDTDDEDDIATSDRQSLDQDSERFKATCGFVRRVLKNVEKVWTEWRQDDAVAVAREDPRVAEWYDALTPDRRKYASQLLRKIMTMRLPESDDRLLLYRHAMLAFERLALADRLSTIESFNSDGDFSALLSVFASVDDIEASLYHEIVKTRLAIISAFEGLVPAAAEKVLQRYLFDHLWLLDQGWDRASSDPKIEKTIKKLFKEVGEKLSKKERDSRIDIVYRQYAGSHVIVELKKSTVHANIHDLTKQISRYVKALEKCLRDQFAFENPSIQAVCVLGGPPSPKDELDKNIERLATERARFVTYDQLIREAQSRYREYLEATKEVERLSRLLPASAT